MTISSSASGFRPGVCVSTNRPENPYDGQVIFETDTEKILFWNGSQWIDNTSTVGKTTVLSMIFGI
jgi:hypothetical protein